VAGFCEHGNEPSGSIKDWDHVDKVTEIEMGRACSTRTRDDK
jgi:hypothetical protein